MDEIEYALMDKADGAMWWYRCLQELVILSLNRHLTTTAPVILDAGCGAGGMMLRLRQAWPQATLHGIDLSRTACLRTQAKTGVAVAVASVDRLPFPDVSMDIVISTDVLTLTGVDEVRAVMDARRCLKPGGLYLVNHPAYAWLMADHDRHVANARRTTAGALRGQLRAAGLKPLFVTYWNTVLFPLMVARRKLWPNGSETSDVGRFSGSLNQVLNGLCGLERVALRRGVALPFGGSVLAVATKP